MTGKAAGEKEPSPVEDTFERAANATGAEYLEAERELRRRVAQGIADAEEVIKRGAAESRDPITKLLADVLLAAGGPAAQDYDNLERLFVSLPERTNRTPLGNPPPAAFQSVVTRGYGARATKFLALRLIKDPDEPAWLVSGSLLYLQEHKDPAATAAILRFIIIAPYAERREWALQALEEIPDPALGAKVTEAEAWALARKLPIPPELGALSGAAPR
jgi:hypothetical protein